MTNKEEHASRLSRIVKIVMSFCNVFSIIVVLGSVSTAFFFSYYWHTKHDFLFYWLLGSSVWLIYTIDHLLDAWRLGDKASSIRHQIHFKFHKIIVAMVCLILGFNVTEAYLHWETISYVHDGVMLFGFFCLYLVFVMLYHKAGKPVYLKEVWVSVFATIGMAVSPLFGESIQMNLANILFLCCFTLLNFANLLTFSRFDLRQDRKDQMQSLASYLGFAKCSRWIFNLLAIIFLLTVVWLFTEGWNHKIKGALAFMVMINILALVNLRYEHFRKDTLYRFWGDFIYLIPGFVVFLRV